MPPPQSMNSPKLTSSHSLPSLSSMLKSPASRTNPRNKLTYFGPGQSSASALRRGKSVMPLPSASRPISSSSNPEDDEVATKKRKVEQTDANRLPFAQPSYIATPERKASISKGPLLSASRLPSLNKPAFADPPKPSPLKAALCTNLFASLSDFFLKGLTVCLCCNELAAKQQQSASTPQKEAPKAATPKTTRAADLMQNIIKEEQASQPVSRTKFNSPNLRADCSLSLFRKWRSTTLSIPTLKRMLLSPDYLVLEPETKYIVFFSLACRTGFIGLTFDGKQTPLQNKTSKGKLVDPADASVPQVPDMRTQLEMSMPVVRALPYIRLLMDVSLLKLHFLFSGVPTSIGTSTERSSTEKRSGQGASASGPDQLYYRPFHLAPCSLPNETSIPQSCRA